MKQTLRVTPQQDPGKVVEHRLLSMIRISCLTLLTTLAMTVQSRAQDSTRLYANSLMVNNYPLNYTFFSINSRGVLGLVDSDPGVATHKPVPFRVTLRRAGMPVRQWPACGSAGTYSVSLDQIWPFARFGDELVVEPTAKPAQSGMIDRSKQIIKLKAVNWLTLNWPKRDGC